VGLVTIRAEPSIKNFAEAILPLWLKCPQESQCFRRKNEGREHWKGKLQNVEKKKSYAMH